MIEPKTKYHLDLRKHRLELIDKPKKITHINFIHKELAVKIITDCGTAAAHTFKTKLRFKQYDDILTKEQSVLTKIMM